MERPKVKRAENTLAAALTPRQIVEELDKYIIGQFEAKRCVAIALRNRARRQMLAEDMQDEVSPKNIIMIGSTGVGKTEIARRLARLVDAPFIKVEASKYTEIGYVGRDVESMIRDLTETAISRVKAEQTEAVEEKAQESTEERLLDCIFPVPRSLQRRPRLKEEDALEEPEEEDDGVLQLPFDLGPDVGAEAEEAREKERERYLKTREKFREWLRDGRLEEKPVEINVRHQSMPFVEIFSPGGIEEMDINFKDMFSNILPNQTKKRRVPVSEARTILMQEESEKLIDMDAVITEAIQRVEDSGIVFLDEIDKIAGRESRHGPDISREGVQRDILPIIEGSTVTSKYGAVRTHHILFIAAGAFHVSSPSDLIPELQGRFPIRVELKSLNKDDFKSILTEPKNALVKQYAALLSTEGIEATITDDAIDEIAALAFQVNESVEDIGARRLHTIMEKLFENLFFDAPNLGKNHITIDAEYVKAELSEIVKDQDLSRYIL
ncbi:ATP-dependent protease ATPase subunit HslU [Candidatus Poribacteria bacterium]|nr:ATP-dependent protease ATPase subunit HslU [Candidatus Poribacteria bacterium]MDE0689839.1 ATP-dependent protease ATPase subunit HslU [Candidatus Poribacteria bacterium]MXV81948.1 ATP-dependent protease ATPase subunit HslU [Candidatus Poribacteria bacterium]MYA58447.1 ATP-dependent protease ATPase subunit HslU [Candidatus Poribacteria bacterium]